MQLFAAIGDCLLKITIAIKQTNCHKIGVAVTDFFQVITRQHAQTARI